MDTLLSVIAVLAAIINAFFMYLTFSSDTKKQVLDIWNSLLRSAGRITACLIFFSVTLLSALSIYLFITTEAPVSRLEIAVLFLHFLNLGMYGGLSIHMVIKASLAHRKSTATSVPSHND